MLYGQQSALSRFVSSLLCSGRTSFTSGEAEHALGIGHGAFLDSAERLQRRKALLSPRQGFYIAIPPQFESWGAPTPDWYIDDLMQHEGQAYYVGALSAAARHGASHQAVMEFQVVTAKRLPRLHAGRNRISFYYRKDMKAVTAGLEERRTNTGTMKISSAALTALDLFRYPRASGGIHNVATVFIELASEINPDQLAELSTAVERSIAQRAGFLLDHLGYYKLTGPMHEALRTRGPLPWAELERRMAKDGFFEYPPLYFDERWRIVVRRWPDPDDV